MQAIEEGIKNIAIGKKGNRHLTQEQIKNIIEQKKTSIPPIDKIQETVFLTSLFYKGFTEDEKQIQDLYPKSIFNTPEIFIQYLFKDILSKSNIEPTFLEKIQKLTLKLFYNDFLTQQEAFELGSFYFNIKQFGNEEFHCLRVISIFILRIRHTSTDEYRGLYEAFMGTICSNFRLNKTLSKKVIHIAEPFDGNEKSFLLTPIIANFLQQKGFVTLCLGGESSGPKYGVNIFNLATKLNKKFITNVNEVDSKNNDLYVNIKDISPVIVDWIALRKKMIKRPFMATLEKFPNILNANISITSAFHKEFSDKMISLGKIANFDGNIVIRKGREGSLAFSLSKPVEIHCSAKKKNGDYEHHHFEFGLQDIGISIEEDGRHPVDAENNASFIKDYLANKKSNFPKEELRAKLTLAGIEKALLWVMKILQDED